MYICPVCVNKTENQVCSICGFDISCDFEHYPTLSKVSASVSAISNSKQAYETNQKKYLSCKNCGGKAFYIDIETHECICLKCSKPLDGKYQYTEPPQKQNEYINKYIINSDQEFREFRIKNSQERFQNTQHKYQSNTISALKNASDLFDLCKKQKGEEKQKTVKKIKDLFEQYPLNRELAVIYAKALEDLSQIQDIKEKEKSFIEIENLYENFQYNNEIISIYAGCLFSFLATQDYKEKKVTLNQLKLLYNNYINMEINDIAIAYAKGLKNLMLEQYIDEREKTLTDIKEVYENFNNCEEVAVIYAEAICNICRYKGKTNITVSVKRFRDKETIDAKNILEKLRKTFPQNIKIRLCADEIKKMSRY